MSTPNRTERYESAIFARGTDDVLYPAEMDEATGRLLVSASITSTTPPSTLVAFITDIPTAGSRVQLASNTVEGVVIQAPSTNTGNIYIGGSDVSSTVYGAELQPGQMVGLAIDNTNKIYVDAATNGDDVSVFGS